MNISLSKFYLGSRECYKLLALVLKYYRFEKKTKIHLEHGSAKSLHTIIVTPPKTFANRLKKDINSIRKEAQLLQASQIASNVFGWSKFLFKDESLNQL